MKKNKNLKQYSLNNNILYVLKMLMYEKNWIYRVIFDYDYKTPTNSLICFYIGPMEFLGQVIRNDSKHSLDKNFYLQSIDENMLNTKNTFFIFIDDYNYTGLCYMILQNKIKEYIISKPKIKIDTLLIDKDYIYKNSMWVSNIPSNEDRMLLYPQDYLENNC